VRKISTVLTIIILDQLTKHWAIMDAPCYVLPILNFVMAPNPGITFGLFPNISPWLIWMFSILVMTYILWELFKTHIRIEKTAYSFIIGGAIGNLIDRLRLGYVVDFLDFHLGSWHYPWPFNVADSFIVIGIGLLIFSHFILQRRTTIFEMKR
jgi:signal peptidase II